MDVLETLNGLNISYEKFDHAPVYTCEEANLINSHISGAKTKNLFLRDRKGKRHFLVVVLDEKQIDLNFLSESLGIKQLSFASPERLEKYLGTKPGSVSILGIINDPDGFVELIIDQDIWQSKALQCHPLVNTSTLVIKLSDIDTLFKHLGRVSKIIKL